MTKIVCDICSAEIALSSCELPPSLRAHYGGKTLFFDLCQDCYKKVCFELGSIFTSIKTDLNGLKRTEGK